jgi:hypothetical protein
MKKVLFPILAMILAIGLSLPVVAHTEGAPQVQTLYAGQDIAVGNVSVWNDIDNLYVKYEINDLDWVITETHLYAGKNVPPTTAPGQFPYDDDDATSVTDTVVTYAIPLADIDGYSMQVNKKGKPTGVMIADGDPGVEPCNNIYIAAHAVVQKCETEPLTLYPELTWQRSSETSVAVYPGYGAQWTKAQGLAIALDPTAIVWDGGTGSQYFTGYSIRSDISWASWVCTQNPSGKSTSGTDLRRFQATFDIPAGYSVTGGTLGSVNPGYENVIPMNDNIYIFVNEALVFWGGTISVLDPGTTDFLGMERRPTQPQHSHIPDFPETDGWYMDGAIPAISSSLFVEGANVLDVFAEEFWTGGGMHELGLTLEGEQTTCETETAWGNGIDFEQANWAMYFTYHVQGPTVEAGNLLGENGEGGVRYKSFANTGSREIYVGIPDLGVGANRVETDFTWSSPGNHTVSFAYDKINDKLVGTVDGTTLEWTNISSTANPGNWDTMLIIIANRDTGTTVNLNDVELNGYSLGDFSGGIGNSGWHYWSVTWNEFSESWTLTGEIELDGSFSGSSESCKVEIQVGPAD